MESSGHFPTTWGFHTRLVITLISSGLRASGCGHAPLGFMEYLSSSPSSVYAAGTIYTYLKRTGRTRTGRGKKAIMKSTMEARMLPIHGTRRVGKVRRWFNFDLT